MRWLAAAYLGACSFHAHALPPADTDAAPDVSPTADTDGDGILDINDNCPTVANANQRDWDGDGHGDECDRCPHLPSAGDPDGDGDGVGDACDQRPAQAGDRRLYWFPFADTSEIAAWNASAGMWSVTTNELAATPVNGHGFLESPDLLGDLAFATSIEVVNPASYEIGFCSGYVPLQQGYCCTVYANPSSGARAASSWQGGAQVSMPVAFTGSLAPGSRVDITGTVTSTGNSCAFSQGSVNAVTTAPRGPSVPGRAVFYTAAPARYRYAFVVAIGS